MTKSPAPLLVLAGVMAATPALAHVGLHPEASPGGALGAGLAHPFGGLDHLLAMAAVGLWAAGSGRAALWQLPASFLAALVAGATVGPCCRP